MDRREERRRKRERKEMIEYALSSVGIAVFGAMMIFAFYLIGG